MNRTTLLSLLACSAFACPAFACSGDDDGPSDTQAGTLTSGADATGSSADSTESGDGVGPGTGSMGTTTDDTAAPTTTAEDTDDTDDTGADDDTGETKDDVPPTGARAILPWLEAGNYTHWAAESGVHPSAGPHGGVRTFVNDALFDSMAMSANVHPPASAAVKELYSGETLIGWAVSLRLDDGPGAEAWYWYELLNGNVIADGTEVDLCANCHADGDDYVLPPFPLQ